MPRPTVEEVSGSRRTRSSGSRRTRSSVQKRKRNRAGDSCDVDEKACGVRKIRICPPAAALPPDATAGREEEEGQAKEEVEANEQVNEDDDYAVSSAPSSPLCEPRILEEVIGHDSNGVEIYKPIDLETFRAYRQVMAVFEEKFARKMKLPTLDESISSSSVDDVQLRHSDQSITKAARKLALGLSSSIGGKPLTQCSGFFIGWDESDESHETGIILTSAHLICTRELSLDSWLCKNEYAPDAEVTVHFPDRTTAKGELCYYQKHYHIALFRTKVKPSLQLPIFNDNVSSGQEVLMLGRDANSILKINHGQVQFKNPCTFERHHFMYAYGAALESCVGGPIVDFNARIVGMSTPDTEGSFIPTSIILKCFHLWRKHEYIPRPHLQLKLCAIRYLDQAQSDKIFFECDGIDEGLIVKEVSSGSMAEKKGIRVGDIIESLDGNYLTSLVELEMMLLHLSQKHHDDCEIDVELGIFRTRIRKRRTIKMTLKLTDEGEEVVRGALSVG